MLLGKPTVAVGRKWATDFIDDGVNGLIVDYEDVEGLRRAVARLLERPDEAARMAERGRAHAAQFTTERTMRAVHALAHRQEAPPHPALARASA
jgi:glycosyltransferase involved in cell wall biosynthesis